MLMEGQLDEHQEGNNEDDLNEGEGMGEEGEDDMIEISEEQLRELLMQQQMQEQMS